MYINNMYIDKMYIDIMYYAINRIHDKAFRSNLSI